MVNLKQSETVTISRSQISFAPYNPRKQNKEVVDQLRRNFKRVGFLGGIQWNSLTGNLIGGHKRLEALDLIYRYTGENDYDVKVEKIELDEKTEKEQNIFLNNRKMQGETDYEALASIIDEIDIKKAGLDEYDISVMESLVPDFKMGDINDIVDDISSIAPPKTEEDKKVHVKGVKSKIKNQTGESHLASYFVVTFKTYDEKAEFLEGIGISGDLIYLTSKEFLKRLNEQ